MQDRIGQRHRLPERREHVDRVKHPAKVGQRRQHEGRNNGNIIKIARIHRVDKAAQGKNGRRQGNHQNRDTQVMHLQIGKEQRQQGHDQRHRQAAQHTTGDIADQNHMGRHRRDQ